MNLKTFLVCIILTATNCYSQTWQEELKKLADQINESKRDRDGSDEVRKLREELNQYKREQEQNRRNAEIERYRQEQYLDNKKAMDESWRRP